MQANLQKYFEKIKTNWNEKSRRQKTLLIGSVALFFTILGLLIFFTTRTTFVPLYSNLKPSETGSIKEALDTRGINSEITDGGTTIRVPKEQVDNLLVELAAEGIPQSGSIYSSFIENAGIGMTDNEFNVMKLDALQQQIANLLVSIDGIQDAQVLITLPEKAIFVQDAVGEASAAITLKTKPGYQFSNQQIRSLYTLVSKSVPNLPINNIVIMNQNFEYFDLETENNFLPGGDFASQYTMKKEIERDIQRQVQSLLGTLMGQNNVVVSVTADIDFTQETREENLVEPVDKENMSGIAISAQRLTESYSGTDGIGGVPQGEDPGDTLGSSYLESTTGNGDYERTEESINNEVNRIRKEIIESPYKIRDLGIQVIVEPPETDNNNQTNVEESIQQILSTIIRTTIDKDNVNGVLTDEMIDNKIAVSFQPLLGRAEAVEANSIEEMSTWVWTVGAIILLLFIAIIIFLLFRKKAPRNVQEPVAKETIKSEPIIVPDLNEERETESSLRKKQIERMAKEQPDEFAKLIRSWLQD